MPGFLGSEESTPADTDTGTITFDDSGTGGLYDDKANQYGDTTPGGGLYGPTAPTDSEISRALDNNPSYLDKDVGSFESPPIIPTGGLTPSGLDAIDRDTGKRYDADGDGKVQGGGSFLDNIKVGDVISGIKDAGSAIGGIVRGNQNKGNTGNIPGGSPAAAPVRPPPGQSGQNQGQGQNQNQGSSKGTPGKSNYILPLAAGLGIWYYGRKR